MSWLTDIFGDNNTPGNFGIPILQWNQMQNRPTESLIEQGTELTEQQRAEYQDAIQRMLSLIENHPEIDLTPYINQLTDLGAGLRTGAAGAISDLQDIRERTESGVGRYLGRSEDYIGSMLDEIKSGSEGFLKGYKKLAREEMPGMDIYRDQITAGTSEALQSLRSMGGVNPNAISSVLKGNQTNMANLALQAAQYKTQSQKDLANAYMTYGKTRGGAYESAASQTQGLANARLGLGQFSTGNVAQQYGITEGMTNALTNIINAGAGLTGTEFGYNELMPWQTGVNFFQNQATQNNPYETGLNWLGNLIERSQAQADQNTITMDDLMQLLPSLMSMA